jgi:hypothetical protein
LGELMREIENMTAAIAAGLLSPALKAKLEATEAEHAKLLSSQDGSIAATVTEFLPRLADTYRDLVENLERVPPRHVDRARTTLKGLVGEVLLVPEDGRLVAEFTLQGGRLMAAADTKISLVAGARYSNRFRFGLRLK